jgi:hypothetical protein
MIFGKLSLGLVLAGCLTSLAPAAITVTRTENHDASGVVPAVNPGMALAVSAVDLVNQGRPTLASATFANFAPFTDPSGTSSPNLLNNGSNDGWNADAIHTAVTTQTTPWTLTYTLNTTGASLGYDITGIDVMSLWNNDYVNQRYSVEVTTIAVPSFTALFGPVTTDTVTFTGPNVGSSLMSSVRDNTTGLLASGVTGLRFTFQSEANPAGAQIIAAYREVDVFGAASVPEPASAGLLLLGAGLAAIRRRR